MALITESSSSALLRAEHYHQMVQKYTVNGFTRLERHWKYAKSLNKTPAYSLALSLIVSGALAGGRIGNAIGESIGQVITWTPRGQAVGAHLGNLGTGLGLMSGGIGGLYAYMTAIENTRGYQDWKSAHLERELKEAITSQYGEDPILRNFTCPISQCVMLTPACTPSGTVYDRDFLLNCPRDEEGRIKDPLRNSPFFENEITDQHEMAFILNKRTLKLLKEDTEVLTTSKDKEIKGVLLLHKQQIVQAIEESYEKAKEGIEELRRAKKVTHKEYQKHLERFFELFGVEPEQELNWSLDWVSVLGDRWKEQTQAMQKALVKTSSASSV